MTRIERLGPDGWERVRDIRLRALADAPDAFLATLDEERAFQPERWVERLEAADAVTFLASDEVADVGIVVGAPYRGAAAAGLFAMWVAPTARRSGVGGRLVAAVVEWARHAGHRRLVLDVADENAAAIRLYESKGFVATGTARTLPPPREHVREHQRELEL